MYVYILSEVFEGNRLYTVGFYDPSGRWVSESDYNLKEDAARRVAWLNGSHNED